MNEKTKNRGARSVKYGFSVLLSALSILILVNAKIVSEGIKAGLLVCANLLIPSLFLFMVLSSFISLTDFSAILSKPLTPITTRLFKLPKDLGAIVLLSLIGGYPVGAKMVSQLLQEERVSPETASRMLCFCVNSGPSFLISAVGSGLFGSLRAGLLFFVSQTLTTLIIGTAFSRRAKAEAARVVKVKRSLSDAFVEAVTGSSSAILTMCAFAVLFSGILHLLTQLGAGDKLAAICGFIPGYTSRTAEALLSGMMEVTTGCIRAAELPLPASVILTSSFVSFSGLSVIFQIISCFQKNPIDLRPFLCSRMLHIPISTLILFPLWKIFCRDVVTVSTECRTQIILQADSRTAIVTIGLIAMCTILVFSVKKTINSRRSM